jgi:hypothetical protein
VPASATLAAAVFALALPFAAIYYVICGTPVLVGPPLLSFSFLV